MDYLRNLIIGLITSITAYLSPIDGEMKSLLIIFSLNFLFGLLAGLLIDKEGFSFKKAWKCVIEATIIFVLICSIYFIGREKGNPEGALQCVSFVSYSVLYFYSVNILKNLKNLAPPQSICYRAVAFLYYVVSVEFVKKIPYLPQYLKVNQDESKQ